MKKYITTKNHSEFKKGVIIQFSDEILTKGYGVYYDSLNRKLCYYVVKNDLLDLWIKKGYIKEVEDKQFTPSDMVDFHWWSGKDPKYNARLDFKDWLKQRNE